MGDRRLVRRCAVLLAVTAAGCSDAADPNGGGQLPIAVAFTVEGGAGGPAEAYERADAIAVTVRAGGTVVLNETQPFDPAASETRVRVRLDRELEGSTVEVDAELLGNGSPLFRGSGSTTLETTGTTALNVPLTPVVSGVVAPDPVATFTAIGETLTLSAAAVFATGDTVPGAPIVWRSLNPEVVTVSGATATAQAEGTAQVEASSGSATATTSIVVAADVAMVNVTPPAAAVSIGQATTFVATAHDRNGNSLVRTFAWSSSSEAVATVTQDGTATGVGSGTTNIVAEAGGTQGMAVLTVVAVPLPPGDLTGEVIDQATLRYRLTWEDRSINEDYFSIERSGAGAIYEEVGRAGADATSFEGNGIPGDVSFRVLACNDIGCSDPSNVVQLEFLAGPPVVETLESPDVGLMAGRVISTTPALVHFEYGSSSESESEGEGGGGLGAAQCCSQETVPIEVVGDQVIEFPVELVSTGQTVEYRIVAVNDFGETVGSIEEMTIPDVSTEGPDDWFYEQSLGLSAEILVMGGGNPIESVTFEIFSSFQDPPYTRVLSDATAQEAPAGSGTRYRYSVTWDTPDFDDDLFGPVFVDVVVRFRSGASAFAPSLFIPAFGESS